jgi:oxygen-independent coproporphyrinogen III oxidase
MHLYLHIPFCRQACHYCDFHFSTNLNMKTAMTHAIAKEIVLRKDYLGTSTLNTIYFGGGTPSLLSENELGLLMDTIHQHFEVSSNAEITLEANPDDITPNHLHHWKKAGINRLSIGVQSFNEQHLQQLHRIHTASESLNCIKLAQDIGFQNISIDLIYAIPAPSHAIWQQDLSIATNLQIPHLSAYCLTIEPQTVFGNWLKKKKIQPIDEEFAAQQFEILLQHTSQQGYEQYEISNFAKPNFYSQHNSSYWQHEAYLGVGPAAHSYNGDRLRQFNVANNAQYIKHITEGTIPAQLDPLDVADLCNEYILTSLRTQWGCQLSKTETWGYSLDKNIIANFEEKNWLQIQNNTLFLTQEGKLFADKISATLFV